ncbi:MAG: glycoside hydrolase family 9 protein [Bacteroidales bacterium]|nr:glycoside hydrolase family 9 protein [Bacteroidales bacterium]
MHFPAIRLIVLLTFLCCAAQQGSCQDSLFLRQLSQSHHLRTLMQPDSAAMGFTGWKNKEIIRSLPLPLVSQFNDLKIKGPGSLKIAEDVTVSGEGSILLETPTSLAVKNSANRSYASAEMIRPLDSVNLESYNRIMVWVKLEASGFYSAFVGVTLYNQGKKISPTPGRFEGQHFVTVYPGQWQQIIWEIPDLYRDKVTGISVNIMLSGSPEGASDRFKLYIDKLSIDEVSPELSRGFDLSKNSIAYCHSGYSTGARKQALVQNIRDMRFQVINDKGQVAFEGAGKKLENGFVLLDFSPLDISGFYSLKIGGITTGKFPIGENAWLSAAWRTLNFFYAERCGFDQPGIHQVCHKDIFCIHPDGRRIAVNGGWHDAADLTQGVGNTARGIISMLELANTVKSMHPDLYTRLLEEGRWGLNWLLNTRFGDGYRDGGMIVGIWTDNMIGTKDDMVTTAKNDPSDNFISSIATSMAVPYYASSDPIFSAWCRKAAREDYTFAAEMMGQTVNQKNETELYSIAAIAAMHLYQLTHEQQYLNDAAHYAIVIMDCQQIQRRKDWSIPLHGFFYESRDKKRILEFFHRSNEELMIQALSMLLKSAPKHPDSPKWMASCKAYADYIRDISKTIEPYEILPAAVYQLNNADFSGIYHEGEKVGLPSMEEYNAQVKNGIHLGNDFYLRRFPVAYQFRGFHAVVMGKAKAAFLLSELLNDKELKDIATRQLEYIVGYNPFAISTIYGEGYDYPALYGGYLGDVAGAVPVGIETFENEDKPYFPMQVNATYKEVWTHTTASVMWLLSYLLGR